MKDEERDMLFASAQAEFFETAARCLRRPDAELAAEIVAGRLARKFGDVLSSADDVLVEGALAELASFERSCASCGPETVRLRLEVEYNRLFVGPTALLAPPYESYYASNVRMPGGGRLRADEERAVRCAYRREGFVVPADIAELPDHVAVELEFLFLLSNREARAWSSGNAASAAHLQSAQALFVREHLGTWIGRLSERAREGASMPFYPAVLDLVVSFCA